MINIIDRNSRNVQEFRLKCPGHFQLNCFDTPTIKQHKNKHKASALTRCCRAFDLSSHQKGYLFLESLSSTTSCQNKWFQLLSLLSLSSSLLPSVGVCCVAFAATSRTTLKSKSFLSIMTITSLVEMVCHMHTQRQRAELG